MISLSPLTKKILKIRSQQESLPGIDVSKKIARKKEKQNRKNGRWAIVVLFFLTTTASFFFYLKTEVPMIWGKITSPSVISTLPDGSFFDPTSVLEEIKSLTKDLRGEYGLYVYRLGSGESYGAREDQLFTAASLIKLPVMLTTYQEAEKGNLDLGKYRDSLEVMGKRSDNTAFKQVVKELGEARIQEAIDKLGMKDTSFKDNKTTPAEIGLFFRKLYQGELISSQNKKEFLSNLTETIYEDRIPLGVPEGIRVAHKIGTEIGSFSDAGIVFADPPAGGFVLVIMSDGARESEASEVLPQITKAVWKFESGLEL